MVDAIDMACDVPDESALTGGLAPWREAVAECFRLAADEAARIKAGTGSPAIWFRYQATAADLIEATIAACDALRGGKTIRHRYIIQRTMGTGCKTTRDFVRQQTRAVRTPRLRGRPPQQVQTSLRPAPVRKGRGAPRGNRNALKHPRRATCQTTCRRYRQRIRALYSS